MLDTLDTVIAFAVIMTVLSLLITLVVQMVSAALSLRGKNLANALALTFQTIDPNIGKYAHSLAAQILRDPIFSDSFWQKKTRQSLDEASQKFIAAQRKLRDAKLRRPERSKPRRCDQQRHCRSKRHESGSHDSERDSQSRKTMGILDSAVGRLDGDRDGDSAGRNLSRSSGVEGNESRRGAVAQYSQGAD